MAKYTEKVILDTFGQMLTGRPLGKITVTELTSKCDISHNTFYYHYRDIYDLLGSWLAAEGDKLRKETKDFAWADKVRHVLVKMKENPDRIYNLTGSITRERLENYLFTTCEQDALEYVRSTAEGGAVSEEAQKAIARYSCYAVMGTLLRFTWSKMDMDIDKTADSLAAYTAGLIHLAYTQKIN